MWNNKLTSIETTKGKWQLLLITGLFAFLFTNLFEPFGIYNTAKDNYFNTFLEINIALLVVICVLYLSQFFIRKLVGIKQFTYLTIFLWFLFESVLIGTTWMLLSILIDGPFDTTFNLWINNIIDAIFLIGLPYFSTIFFLNYIEIKRKLTHLSTLNNKEKTSLDKIFSFKDTSGKAKIGIRFGDILYLESNDNYVTIYYQLNKAIEKFMLRNTITYIESELKLTHIIRCHRSFMVNLTKIIKKEKTPKGFNLNLKNIDRQIPVSKSYTSEFNKILN